MHLQLPLFPKGTKLINPLNHINDVVSSGNYSTDIDDQEVNNYTYDSIDNLISDA